MTTETGAGEVGQMSSWRIAAWVAAACVLVLPLVAMQFTSEVNWTGGDFVVAAVLLFGSLGAYELAARKTGRTLYRAGVGLGIAATFFLIWGNGAVSVSDSPADALYYLVALAGIASVIVALTWPRGGAAAMLATALALVAVTAITLIAGMVPNPYVSVLELLSITAFFVMLFGGAAWLLREASRKAPEHATA